MQVEIKLIPTKQLWANTGQVAGLPTNPRFIRDERFEKLVKSIQDEPEMLALRECLVIPYAKEYVVIAGNMRLRASNEVIGMNDDDFADLIATKENDPNFNEWFKAISDLRESRCIPCKVLPQDTPIEKLKSYTVKDNISFGQHDFDLLANEWDEVDLLNWGMELPVIDDDPEDEDLSPKPSPVRLTIEFDDLDDFETIKAEIKVLLEGYSGAKLKE